MIPKTPEELEIMKEGGRKLGDILAELLEFSGVGVPLTEIEKKANELIEKSGGTASFKTVEGYHWATCLCVNEAVVHGIPTDYTLKDGDKLTIDIGLLYKGLHTDTAWTKLIGTTKDPGKVTFLKIGEETLRDAITVAKAGNHVGDISRVIQEGIEGAGYSIVKTLVGHGVGRQLHEDPQIPGFVRGAIENTPELVAGETIAIEVIYAQGCGQIVYENDDGWTLSTRDGSLASVFEHTIAITKDGPIVLTKGGK